MKNFFAELRRRNVHKVAIVYAVIAWLLIQVAFIPMFEAPGWAIKTLIVLLAPWVYRGGIYFLGFRSNTRRDET